MKRQEEEESPNTYVNVLGGTVVEYQDKIGKVLKTSIFDDYLITASRFFAVYSGNWMSGSDVASFQDSNYLDIY